MKKFFIVGIVVIIALIAANELVVKKSDTKEIGATGDALIGGPFTLTDQNGKKVSDSDFRGKLMLVYFGFSSCPAICPTDMANITNVMNALADDAGKIVPVFITIDPERDTQEKLKSFMQNFHPSIIALTGTMAEVDAVIKSYRAYANKVQNEMMEGYMYDHSTFTYLMGKDGKYISHFTHNSDVNQVVSRIKENL